MSVFFIGERSCTATAWRSQRCAAYRLGGILPGEEMAHAIRTKSVIFENSTPSGNTQLPKRLDDKPFLSIAKAMAYNHALACISSALTSISRQSEYIINRRLHYFRNDDIQILRI